MRLLQTYPKAFQSHFNRYNYLKSKSYSESYHPSLSQLLTLLKHKRLKVLDNFNFPGLSRLIHLTPSPNLLFYRGQLHHLLKPTIGIIGSRKPTLKARHMAKILARSLSHSGFSIVSGMASGIDGIALHAAYQSQKLFPAIAVLGTAITKCYPQSHFGLYHALCQHGLVCSEYPPGFNTQPFHFILRNEIIAALSDAIVVVEAARKSGTFHTVSAALRLGKPIFTFELPAEGNQYLIETGAERLETPQDIFKPLYALLQSQLFQRNDLAHLK
jgi:DNA processing protein